MIPSVVARQVRETVLDYLSTTFALADPDFARTLFEFLDSEDGLFKGPYLDVRLPFRKATRSERVPLEIRPLFDPYKHQLKAFQRLYSSNGHQPQHTLVTTGTGSGKTECFLYPILDHCHRNSGRRGVKAILLYPMNALASDQAGRLARTLWDDERLRGRVSAGLYVGGKGTHGTATREHLVDKREVLRDSPPDILLTNYKMLDFLLLRPEDRPLWQHNDRETLRYLVLDELHTYDGAQGSDVACLIRRLKRRMDCRQGSICCVGTSATIAGTTRDATITALTDFAEKVFDEQFFEDSVVTEDRYTADETLGVLDDDRRIEIFPPIDRIQDVRTENFDDFDSWMRRQAELWLGEGAAEFTPVELGEQLTRHDFLRQILKVLAGRLRSLSELDSGLLRREPVWADYSAEDRTFLLESFLALVSVARRSVATAEHPELVEPFLSVQVQLWLRELRRLLRRVQAPDKPAEFVWADELAMREADDSAHWLPVVQCRDCGAHGMGTYLREAQSTLHTELRTINENWLRRSTAARFMAFGHDRDELFPQYVCPACLLVGDAPTCPACAGDQPVTTLAVRLAGDLTEKQPKRFLARCPECGTDDSLRIMGSRAPSLLSVAISHLYLSDYNQDKKLLAFTDSVQDASHRAGFFGARTYRFNLRTAIQGLIESTPDDVPLSGFSNRLLEYWGERLDAPRLITTLIPDDLRDLPTYQSFIERAGGGNHDRLRRQLEERLSWETVMEYGYGARVGRTLEQTLCSTVAFDEDRVDSAAEVIALELKENDMLDTLPAGGVSKEQIVHLLHGLLQRTRVRGGIDHPFLTGFIREEGSWFLLTKRRQKLMSPFHRESIPPRFLTDRTPGGSRKESVFDSIVSPPASYTWYRDWAQRVLGVDRKDAGLNAFYRECLTRLTGAGVLKEYLSSKQNRCWSIDVEALRVTRNVGQVVCAQCRRAVALPAADLERWVAKPCPRYRCDGTLEKKDGDSATYYGRIYRSGRLERIFSHEHTGLLTREDRESVEERFKTGSDPDAPNLLVCTPTLEMGIDIGDLSGAMLCSVPPTTSNYLQRIGRAGRSTGNAFCMTLATARPHDLYFHAEPEEMMAGQVVPPGCFLDAPEMLKRQLIAHGMDCWARSEPTVRSIPGRVSLILNQTDAQGFPGRFVEYFRKNTQSIVESFLTAFRGLISEANRQRLEEFAAGNTVPELIEAAFESIRNERDNLRGIQRRAKLRLQEIEKDPESSEDPDEEKAELELAQKLVSRLIQELGQKYPLNALTDEGVLPNYAFPEPGVTLESTVSEQLTDGKYAYHAHEYHRPASSAIRELAPFNTFYAEGRRVRIDEIDIGSKAQPLIEEWRLCAECSHMERLFPETVVQKHCPRCKDDQWPDAGQVRRLVHFRRSRSLATRIEARTNDEKDDREEAFYELSDMIDAGPETYSGARLIPDLPFGYELLRNLKLREINFGLQGMSDMSLKIAGRQVSEKGFEVCLDCGRARRPGGGRGSSEQIAHASYCRAKKTGNSEKIGSVYLYRQIESEAIRVLLPVASMEVEQKQLSFKAAIELGLRRRFQGDPGHLQLRYMREPIAGGDGERHFLVIFDAVPGGTGYLAEIWQKDHFLNILDEALNALQACSCQRNPLKDGCYRCLFAYQMQRDLPKVSSRVAQEMITEILSEREELTDVQTLSEVTLESKLESELETRFLEEMRKSAGEANWKEIVQGGELRWHYRVGARQWEIRAQVDLTSANGVGVATRPDFLISPVGEAAGALPVAVYCDGFTYHVCPNDDESRLADDIEKRRAILQSGRYRVFSVTWKDVKDFAEGGTMAQSLFQSINLAKVRELGERSKLKLGAALGTHGNMNMLLRYLEEPDCDQWRRLAGAYLLVSLAEGPLIEVDQADRLELDLGNTPDSVAPDTLRTVQPGEVPVLSRSYTHQHLAALTRCSKEGFAPEKVRAVVRLFDDDDSRREEGFETAWRTFLQAWNLLQHHDGVEFTSSTFIEGSGASYAKTVELAAAAVPMAAESGAVSVTGEESARLSECLELATEVSRPLIRAVAESELPLPDLEFELDADGRECGPEPELAWPDLRIAVLAPRQLEDRVVFESAGWKVFEQSVQPDEFLPVLREAVATGAAGYGAEQ